MSKILLIEDESALQKTLGAILVKKGYKVIKALNGEIGLRLAKTESPDLIVLDIILPKMNGFEVLEELKKDDKLRATPVIILTNLETMDNIEKAINNGARSYLVKSNYTLDEIVEKIRQNLIE